MRRSTRLWTTIRFVISHKSVGDIVGFDPFVVLLVNYMYNYFIL
jgi:hypothetical protein